MDLVESLRKAWVVTGLTLRYLMGTRRGIAIAVLAAVPLLLTVGLALARVDSFGIQLFQILLIPLFFPLVLIFVALVNASTLIRDEIEDNTLPYLLTRPISKPALIFYKYVAYLASALVLLVPPIVLAYGVTELHTESPFSADLDVLWGFLLATILGSAAYGAVFLFASVLVRLRRLPQLDPVAFGVRNPAESAVLGILDFRVDVDPFFPQHREKTVEVLHTVVDHERGASFAEIRGLRGKDRPDRVPSAPGGFPGSPGEERDQPVNLEPEVLAIPAGERLRILRFEEDASDPRHADSAFSNGHRTGGPRRRIRVSVSCHSPTGVVLVSFW